RRPARAQPRPPCPHRDVRSGGRPPVPPAGRCRPGAPRTHVRVRAPVVRHRRPADLEGDRGRVPRRRPPSRPRRCAVLIKLVRSYLGKYKKWLALIVAFQIVQAIAQLVLPTLNADIIDNGALKGDTSYIWKIGSIMLAVTFVQVVFAILATYYGSRTAM